MKTDSIHDSALNWFVRLRDADAPEAAWLEFMTWLEADPAHARAYDRIEQTWAALDASPAPSTDTNNIIVAPIAANDVGPRRDGKRFGRAWLAPFAASAAAAVMAVGLWPEISGQGRFQSYRTDDVPREITLSDGTEIAMNRHSELRVRIGSQRRDVTLADGEVAFDVAHDAQRPFIIAANDHQVRVLGTAFNVVNHDGQFSVGVSRGLVAVSGTGFAQPVHLSAGHRVVQTGGTAAVTSAVDGNETTAWRQGVLVYREADLNAVAEDLSRYFNKPVSVSTSARALRFTGALRIGDEATMLRQLQDFVPIQVIRANDGIQLTARDGA